MQNPQPSKQFRWIGQPSEEDLLGIRVVRTLRPARAVLHGAQEPPARQVVIAAPPARRPRARSTVTVLAVAVVVWLVLGGAGAGFRFHGSAPAAVEPVERAPGQVVHERTEIASIPRAAPSLTANATPARGSRRREDDRGSREDGTKDSDPPGGDLGGEGGGGESGDPAEKPLAQADLPLLGTVTVENPDLPLPESVPQTPDLPSTEDVLPGAVTITLP